MSSLPHALPQTALQVCSSIRICCFRALPQTQGGFQIERKLCPATVRRQATGEHAAHIDTGLPIFSSYGSLSLGNFGGKGELFARVALASRNARSVEGRRETFRLEVIDSNLSPQATVHPVSVKLDVPSRRLDEDVNSGVPISDKKQAWPN